MIPTTTTSFVASAFHLRSFGGPIRIEPHKNGERTVVITIKGSEERRRSIRSRCTDGVTATLEDSKAREGSGDGITVTTNNGSSSVRVSGNSSVGNIVINGASISVNGDVVIVNGKRVDSGAVSTNDEPALSAVVLVPLGAAITIDDIYADAEIGDVYGTLAATTKGTAKLNVGRVGGVELQCRGTGSIRVLEVNGDMSVVASGCGDVKVKDGVVIDLVVSASGTGKVSFSGTARRANLSSSGCGDIRLTNTPDKVVKSTSGVGNIRIG